MAFRYSLQSLLRLRQSLERQEEQRLFAIAALVARLRAEMDRFERDNLEVRRAGLLELAEASSGAALQFAAICGAAYETARKKLESQLAEAERKRLTQLAVYHAARQKCEILQGLKERQKEAYELEFARHEQQTADEAFLIRTHLSSDERFLPPLPASFARP
jgi:flagellar export protein FliJ